MEEPFQQYSDNLKVSIENLHTEHLSDTAINKNYFKLTNKQQLDLN